MRIFFRSMQVSLSFQKVCVWSCGSCLHKENAFVQVEPYLDCLVQIHELFADGKTPEYVLSLDGLRDVYLAEKEATGALITFYALSMKEDFRAVIDAVKIFAQKDADRIRMRDVMRAAAIAELAATGQRLFVEAGYIHYGLYHFLSKQIGQHLRVQSVFLLQPIVDMLQAKRRNIGPGDVLTLLYVLHESIDADRADLLAARSLIAVQLVAKEELQPDHTFPHCEDDAMVNALVSALDYEQCRQLYQRIRGVSRNTALRYARQFVDRRTGCWIS
jgi:phage anti-repressor protein